MWQAPGPGRYKDELVLIARSAINKAQVMYDAYMILATSQIWIYSQEHLQDKAIGGIEVIYAKSLANFPKGEEKAKDINGCQSNPHNIPIENSSLTF